MVDFRAPQSDLCTPEGPRFAYNQLELAQTWQNRSAGGTVHRLTVHRFAAGSEGTVSALASRVESPSQASGLERWRQAVSPEKFKRPDGTRAVGDASNFLAVRSLVVAACSRRRHRFGEAFRCVDGSDSVAALIEAADRRFYGTTLRSRLTLAPRRFQLRMKAMRKHRLALTALLIVLAVGASLAARAWAEEDQKGVRRLLYVASPGVRNYLEHGGHGILVFDIDRGHKFVRRIPTAGVDEKGRPINVKGICASAVTSRVYVSTLRHLMCLDLATDKLLWERTYKSGCDRMSISPDGKVIYLPSLEKDHWKVVDAADGEVIKLIVPRSGAHNTVYGLDGRHAYMAGLKSPLLTVAETRTHTTVKTVGPFSDRIRPFTVNGRQTLCFVNVNKLLGFEVGDLRTGKMLHRVEVQGYEKGKVKRHGCPSHGIGMTPDDKEIWVTDGANSRLHLFDATVMPPRQIASIKLRDQPGWVTFSIDGTLAYPSTGDVIDTRTRKIITGLTDEQGRQVQSEKLLEIDFRRDRPIRTGDQFGIGRKR